MMKCSGNVNAVLFDIMNIQPQCNQHDCGLFALACATELVHGCDPTVCHWDVPKMIHHLLCCLEKGKIDRFPIKKRRVPLGMKVRNKKWSCQECINLVTKLAS